ncbi:hypothetical protein M514_04204 [Trichuris suis]|uniref:Uncharacterized protein n=1 Tax=Trichuris suis TaxID=68888 RepID=A0A085MCS6_9BILA|nr:hypothetical protein M513_04204 [Trichuris suis]KFD72139.1 hypothetical protein M514_04204 [Trichuris suis]
MSLLQANANMPTASFKRRQNNKTNKKGNHRQNKRVKKRDKQAKQQQAKAVGAYYDYPKKALLLQSPPIPTFKLVAIAPAASGCAFLKNNKAERTREQRAATISYKGPKSIVAPPVKRICAELLFGVSPNSLPTSFS